MCNGGYYNAKTIIFFWLTLSLVINAEKNCSKNNQVQWLNSDEPQTRKTDNIIGKQWLIDCRVNDSTNVVRLLKDSTLEEKHSDGITLIKKDQSFTFLSVHENDVGKYYCNACNITKFVGSLGFDNSRNPIQIHAIPRLPIRIGSNVTYICEVKGVYFMSWYMVRENGTKVLMRSEDDSTWVGGWRYTKRRFVISNFRDRDEQMYMCVIRRMHDNYTAEREVYPALKKKSIPIHWYYTSFSTRIIEGHLFRVILHVYSCHLPLVVGLMVAEPFKGVHWFRNFTADQPTSIKIAKKSAFGIRMEMHVHPGGSYRDNLHVTVVLVNLQSNYKWKVMDKKYFLRTRCKREKCNKTAANTLECPRYLDDLEEKLNATFILKLQDPCIKNFTLRILDRDSRDAALGASTLMEKSFRNNTQTKMQLKGFMNHNNNASLHGRVNFQQFFLTLVLYKEVGNTHRVKLLLDMPDIGMRGNFVVMEDDFNIDDSVCPSPGQPSRSKTKLIAIIVVALLISGLLLFAVGWIFRRYRHPTQDEFLLTSAEDEAL